MESAAKFVDAHGHLNFDVYDEDREAAIQRCREKGVLAVTVGVDIESTCRAGELARKYPDVIRATAGLHPLYAFGDTKEAKMPLGEIRAAVLGASALPEVVAIGECGLDYARLPAGEEAVAKARQRETFAAQIEAAAASGKPLMIHCRDAYDDVLGMLDEARGGGANVRAHFHFFAGDESHLRKILDAGDSVSFTGVITFADSYDSLVKYPPWERLLSETDCPYVTPAPHRGKRNEPAFVVEVVKRLADLRGATFDQAAVALRQSAARILGV